MWHVWNYAYIYALGESAEELKMTFQKMKHENDLYRENLDRLEKEEKRLMVQNERVKKSSEKFNKILKALGDDLEGKNGLKAIESRYEDILERSITSPHLGFQDLVSLFIMF